MEYIVRPIYNEGDELDWRHYRGITVMNVTYEVLSRIFRRLPRKQFVGQYQAGFKEGCTSSDQMFILR